MISRPAAFRITLAACFLAAIAPFTPGTPGAVAAAGPQRVPLVVHTFEQADSYEGRDWHVVAPYLSWVNVTKAAEFDRIAAAGIKTVWYQDPYRICATADQCSDRPPARELGDRAFMRCRGGARLVTSYSPKTDTYFGDPSSAQLAQRTRAYTDAIVRAGHLDYVWFDNAMLLDDEWAERWSCRPAADWTFGNGAPYSAAAYAAAMEHFDAQAARPVLMEGLCNGNGATSPLGTGRASDPAGITLAVRAPNTVGGMCESFAAGWSSSNPKATGDVWESDENTALQVQSYGKDFVAWPYYGGRGGDTYDERGYYYASFMLIYDPVHSYFKFNAWCRGATNCGWPKSGMDIEPEALLVPTDPLESATWASRIGALKNGGVYAREFSHCFVAGRPIGACAAVVNPDLRSAQPLPRLRQRYGHAVALRGFGAFTGADGTPNLGDDGKLLLDAPIPSVLPPEGWAILVR